MITRNLGVDPGKGGAIACVEGEELLWIMDMPVVDDVVSAPLLDRIYSADEYGPWQIETSHPVAIEDVHSMPGEGGKFAFAFGRNYGILLGFFAANHHRLTPVTPQEWKATFKLNGVARGLTGAAARRAKKEASIAKAIELWPGLSDLFRLKSHDGRAEAALIALHYSRQLRKEAGGVEEYQAEIRRLHAELDAVRGGAA